MDCGVSVNYCTHGFIKRCYWCHGYGQAPYPNRPENWTGNTFHPIIPVPISDADVERIANKVLQKLDRAILDKLVDLIRSSK